MIGRSARRPGVGWTRRARGQAARALRSYDLAAARRCARTPVDDGATIEIRQARIVAVAAPLTGGGILGALAGSLLGSRALRD